MAAGLAMAAVDGANRSETSYQRMRAQQLAADAVFFPSQVGVHDADLTKLDRMPEVAAWGGFATTPSTIDEIPGGGPIVPIGSAWFSTIERAKVLEGRLPDPRRDDEAVINDAAVAALKPAHLGVGSVVTLRSLSPADYRALGNQDPPANYDWSKATGPVDKLRIVGVIRIPAQYVLSFASGPWVLPSPGWAAARLGSAGPDGPPPTGQPAVADFYNAVVRLNGGAAAVPAFDADVARAYGRADIPVKDLADDIKRVQRSLDVERTAVLLFAAAVVLASVVLVGQAVARSVRTGSGSVPELRAMGLPPSAIVAGLVAPHAVTIATAAAVSVVSAVLLSALFPIGLGHRLDPALGSHVDWRVLAVGVPATVIGIAAGCALAAWITTRRLAGRPNTARTRLVGAATRLGVPVPTAVGASMALEATPTRTSGPARAALLAAIVGVLGVVGALTLVNGIDDVLHQPERVGQTWDLEAYSELSVGDQTKLLAADRDVTAFAVRSRVPTLVDGTSEPLYSMSDLQGSISFVTLKGRAPVGTDEIALGPRTAALLHTGIGGTVTAGAAGTKLRVVGITLLAQTPHGSYDEGGWMTPQGLDATQPTVPGSRDDETVIRLRSGAPVQAVADDLTAKGIEASPPIPPPDVTNLSNVRSLPALLAAFLVLLAVGAVAHALLAGVRGRRRDLAVLRALGLTPGQAAACVLWQAAIIAAVALVIGVPLGLAIGRQMWRVLADSLSFVYVAPIAGLVLLALVPIVLAVVGALALWPARGAAHLSTAEVLRTE